MGGDAPEDRGTRPSKLALAVGFLQLLRSRSTCKRLKVAALVCDPDLRAIYAMGYNGPARGESNDSCRNEKGNCGCVHAEANALVKLRTDQGNLCLFSTTSPCELCAKLIVNCGQITRVIFLESYRDSVGVKILKDAKIECGPLEEDNQGPSAGVSYHASIGMDYHWSVIS